jgi:hypothetical protein
MSYDKFVLGFDSAVKIIKRHKEWKTPEVLSMMKVFHEYCDLAKEMTGEIVQNIRVSDEN